MVRTFVCVTLRLCPVYTKESKKRFELEREKGMCVSISFWNSTIFDKNARVRKRERET